VLGTYASVLAVCASSLLVGQAAIALCGRREWSWLSPAVGLALICALCWATVRMPGNGVVSAIAVLVVTVAAAIYLRGRVEEGRDALAAGAPVALIALAASRCCSTLDAGASPSTVTACAGLPTARSSNALSAETRVPSNRAPGIRSPCSSTAMPAIFASSWTAATL